MVNCTYITDEDECRKHGVCSCDWNEGKSLFNLALTQDKKKL